jgi:hypothetical protein
LVAGAGHGFFCPDGGDGDVQVEDVADGVNLERERERERERELCEGGFQFGFGMLVWGLQKTRFEIYT